MSSYLERLKRLAEKKRLPERPSKPPKGTCGGFDGSMGKTFSSDADAYDGFDGFDGFQGRNVSPRQGAGKDLSPVAPVADPAVMTVPAGVDPFATAAELIRLAREKETPGLSYKFRLTDQRAADRRNREAAQARSTDRYCGCGALATFAWPDDGGRDVWRCLECGPVRGCA